MADVACPRVLLQYSLTAPLRKQHTFNHSPAYRDDHRAAIEHIFRLLDREGRGRISRRLLCPEPVTEEDLRDVDTMIRRLQAGGGGVPESTDDSDENTAEVDLEAFALIVGPYLREVRRRKRFH